MDFDIDLISNFPPNISNRGSSMMRPWDLPIFEMVLPMNCKTMF